LEINIRKAIPEDSPVLTEISFAAKRHWHYPEEYYQIWRDELTISPEYIKQYEVYAAEAGSTVVGYCSVVKAEKEYWVGKIFVEQGYWLEHIFIRPEFIGKGTGTRLVQFIAMKCRKNKIDKLYVFAEPNAAGFYDKIGAVRLRESVSSIAGRTLPVYLIPI
jgi:maltose O-acetyltransferase